jgi:2'-5' RNA ligase
MVGMPRHRLGVVLLVPPPFDAEVDALRKAVGDPSLGRIPPHITLVPPVNVNDDRLGEALATVRQAAAATRSPLRLTLGPPATFLPVTPVLYLAVSGDEEALFDLRDGVFVPPLQRPLDHEFVPHVTLADGIDAEVVETALVALASYEAAATIERVHVLEQREGRRWAALADAPFGPPAIVGRGSLPLELTVTEQPPPGTPGRPFAVTARRDGAVVGVATGLVDGDSARLHELTVVDTARGTGVGAHLLAAVEALARDRGATALSAPPHPFLERHGFAHGVRQIRGGS